MDMRLTVLHEGDTDVVRVDGRLSAGSVEELTRLLRSLTRPIVVDLANLLSADDAGVAVLRTLAEQGARLVGASPYVALLLDREKRGPGRPPRGERK